MATTTIAIPQFTVTPVKRTFGPTNIPVGTSHLLLTLDLTNLLAGDRIWLNIQWDDGSGSWAFSALTDGFGPGLHFNKFTQQTTGMQTFGVDLGVPTAIGWQIRATVWSEVASIIVPSGSIGLS